MKFFQSIEQHLDGMNLNLVVTKTSEGLTVSMLPQLKCKDETKGNLIPLIIKGTSEQLDEQFVTLIQKPLSEASGFSVNLLEFEKAAEIASEKSAIAKAGKVEATKAKDSADKEIVKAEKMIEEKNIPGAILKIEAALKYSPKHKKANELLKLHKKEAPLFEMIEEVKSEKIEKLAEIVQAESVEEVKAIVEEAQPVKREAPKGPNVIINKVPLDYVPDTVVIGEPALVEPTSMKEVGMEEQQKQTQPIVAHIETDEAYAERVAKIEEVVIAPVVAPVPPTTYDKVDANGKPMRADMEPINNFEVRLTKWALTQPANPAATQPNAIPLVEEKSPMQEMAEEDMVRRETQFNAESPIAKVEDIPSASTHIETLG